MLCYGGFTRGGASHRTSMKAWMANTIRAKFKLETQTLLSKIMDEEQRSRQASYRSVWQQRPVAYRRQASQAV